MMPSIKDQVFQFRLTSAEREMLNAIAEEKHVSAGDALREIIHDHSKLVGTPIGVMPPGLDEHGKKACKVMSGFVKRHRLTDDEVRMYSPRQWCERRYEYCVLEEQFKLIVFHGSTNLGQVLEPGWSSKLLTKLEAELAKHGLFVQNYVGFVAIELLEGR
jgi:hypothetical protein